MKINYLLYSVAFASAFAACSDELAEVANAPVNEALAGRPVVGNVTLNVSKAGETATTRLNESGTGFVKGDKIKLFLMDEFNLGTESDNANFTNPRDQWNWTYMYTMMDYIHTNYIYVAQEDGGASFVNQSAQLVEGNYFAFHQADESYRTHEITNRQDLWAYINPSPVLAQKAANVYANMENDFYLDYQQVYRDDDADLETGVLSMEMGMKPVMNRVKFTIGNLNNAKYRVRDIVIRRKDKKAVPTLAYIRPVSSREWNNNVMNDDQNFDWETVYAGLSTEEEKAAFNNKWTLKEYHEDFDGSGTSVFVGYNGGATAFTQEDARTITYFETTADGKIPYGLGQAEAEPAFAYTVKFPGEGHELNAHAPFTAQERVDVFFALPIFASDFADYEILVEGDYWDITLGTAEKPGDWVPGYWSLKTPTGSNNVKWFMESAFDHDWTTALGQNWPTGTLTIDFNDMHLYGDPTDVTVTAPYRVSTSEEILNVLKNDNILFKFGKQKTQIELNGVNIAFNQAIADQIKKNADDWKNANPSATPYVVEFTASSDYAREWKQWEFDMSVSAGTSTSGVATDNLYNSALVVTAANVLDLPVNFEQVPVTFAAPQKVSKNFTAAQKVIITNNVTVADGVTFDGASKSYIMEDITVDLGKKGIMKGVCIWKEHQVVTVKGTSKDAKFAGNGYGKVVLPRVDEYTVATDGTVAWGTGFNCVIDVTGYTVSNGVLSFPVADTKKVSAFSTPEYAPTGYDHAKNYQSNGSVVVEATTFKPGDEVE